jgi:hypothetical protein
MRIFTSWCCVAMLCLAGGMVSTAHATIWEIQKEIQLYGDLDQDDIPGIGSVCCGPAAAVNSFVYLQNKYPNNYNGALVPDQDQDLDNDGDVDFYDHMIAVGIILSGAGYMNTTQPNGTFVEDFIYGKYTYLEQVAPGKTTYGAQDAQTGWSHHTPYPWVQLGTAPTWNWMYDELVKCQDVEILLSWLQEEGGHYVTLTSLHWDDVLQSGWIDYIDPADGLWKQTNMVFDPQDLRLELPQLNAWISMAVEESPEPASLVLLAAGTLVLVAHRRRA